MQDKEEILLKNGLLIYNDSEGDKYVEGIIELIFDSMEAYANQQTAPLQAEIQNLKNALWQDKSNMAQALSAIIKWADGYEWILEGRGPYEWDDQRYKDEVKGIIIGVTEIARRALSNSGNLVKQVHEGLFEPEQDPQARIAELEEALREIINQPDFFYGAIQVRTKATNALNNKNT